MYTAPILGLEHQVDGLGIRVSLISTCCLQVDHKSKCHKFLVSDGVDSMIELVEVFRDSTRLLTAGAEKVRVGT